MSRLIVVSNRVAPIDEGKGAAGGLAVAVLAALKQARGIWFGWSGDLVPIPATEPERFEVGNLTYATIDLTPQDFDEYYNGFANSMLWPLFHYRLDLTSFTRREYAGYLRVNELFAQRLMPLLQEDDVVWVHDYHLIPLGEALRQTGFKGRLGFFLHTPLPACEVLVALPTHRQLMRSLCAYDLVGVQTKRDMSALRTYIEDEAGGTVDADGRVQAYDRALTARAYPISCDTHNVAQMAAKSARDQQTLRMVESIGGRNLMIGVDRLDYSKGLVRRFRAFERLLETYPENRSRATLLQLAPPTRSDVPQYAEIRRELEEAEGHISGRFAEIDWVPIRYLNKSLNRKTLAGFFRAADVGLVTPLRDGMNLVAKEYLAAQDPEDPGVLVLSQFAGAAEQLDQALIVNPYDIDEVAEAMQRALVMPREERKARWQASFDHLTAHDVVAWREAFLKDLSESDAFEDRAAARLSA